MGDYARTEIDNHLAAREAEDSDWRRFQAAAWLESLLGPIGLSSSPSEREFISHLRNGVVVCNAINKVQPGAVPKVVENHVPQQTLTRDFQPLPAYQYFENMRNFLVAVEGLKLPAFEASDLERDTLESGSVAKVVDCILYLKLYHESKQMNGGTGCYKPTRSPMISRSASRIKSQPISSESCKGLDMSVASEKQLLMDVEINKLKDSMDNRSVCIDDRVADTNDDKILTPLCIGNMDPENPLTRHSTEVNSVQKKFQKLPEYIEETEELAMKGLKDNRHTLDIITEELLGKSRITGLVYTELCQQWQLTGTCFHGECKYAHGIQSLLPITSQGVGASFENQYPESELSRPSLVKTKQTTTNRWNLTKNWGVRKGKDSIEINVLSQGHQILNPRKPQRKYSVQNLIDCVWEMDPGFKRPEQMARKAYVSHPSKAMQYVELHGIALAEKYPLSGTCGECRCEGKGKYLRGTRLEEVDIVDNSPKTTEMIDKLLKKHPIIGIIWVDRNFRDLQYDSIYEGPGPYDVENPPQEHAVVLLGFGKHRCVAVMPFQNSFGRDWGRNGLSLLKRGTKLDDTHVTSRKFVLHRICYPVFS